MMSRQTKEQPVLINQLLLGAILLCSFLMGCVPLWNSDIWMHLKTGQLILERLSIPYLDWYSFTDPDRPWIEMHWVFQVVAAKLFAWGGVPLLVLTKAFLQMVTVAICWRAAGDRLPVWAKSVFMLLLVVCLAGRSIVRPDMVTTLLLSLSLLILIRTTDKPRLMWFLPLVQVVWTNCHGLFVLGLVVLGCYCGDRVARSLAKGRCWLEKPATSPEMRVVLLATGATVVACLANPYLFRGAMFPFVLFGKLGNDPSQEHMPPLEVFHEPGATVYVFAQLILWCATLISFVWLARHRRLSVMRLLLFIAFSYLGWIAWRNITIFGIVASVIGCWNVADSLQLRSPVSSPANGEATKDLPLAILVATLALILSVVTSNWHHVTGRDYFGIGEMDYYIHGPAEFAGRPGMPSRAFVIGYDSAAVFIFHNSPERKVFLDGRLEVYRDSTIVSYFEIQSDMRERKPEFAVPLLDNEQHLPTIVIENNAGSRRLLWAMLTYPNVRLVYADSTGAVFIEQSLADQLQLPLADPTPLDFTFVPLESDGKLQP